MTNTKSNQTNKKYDNCLFLGRPCTITDNLCNKKTAILVFYNQFNP